MPIQIQPPRIDSAESPRKLIAKVFRSLNTELPIRGGWGYSQDDAVIIDKTDPVVTRGIPFDGVGIEYLFVEKRLYVELIVLRPIDDRYSGIQWKLNQQRLLPLNGRPYDVLEFTVTAFPDRNWAELKAEWEGPNGFKSPGFDQQAHAKKRDERMVTYATEYWFEIGSFYGQ